jgi:transaldolase
MANLCTAYRQNLPLSVEVFTAAPEEMFSQACELAQSVRYQNLAIKIPIGWEELEVIRNLRLEGIAVNCTCLFNEAQCLLAANAGANYISLFMGRMKDLGIDPLPVIANVRTMLHRTQSSCELIVGSIRHARDITDAYNAGAHIVTAGMKFFDTMSRHPQTTKSVQDFLNDFKAWQS